MTKDVLEAVNGPGRLILGPLATTEASVRDRMLATVLPSPASLALTYATLLMIAFTAAVVADAAWAWSWAWLSFAIVVWRAFYPRFSQDTPEAQRLVNIILASVLLFTGYGLGCAASILSGSLALSLMTLTGVLGIVAGLASRWAAVPRPAITAMALTSLPPVVALASSGGPELVAALVMVMLVVSVSTFTLQNHHYLLSAISAEQENLRLAQTDPLTGLTNRVELERRLAQACLGVAREGQKARFAVLYLDLDGFKGVNDSHGHAAGDTLLRQVAQRLRELIDPHETIARVGGDEFVVLLSGADELVARSVADQIIDSLSREHVLPEGSTVRVGCSAGVSLAPEQGSDPDTLMQRADKALYVSKGRGKGQSGVWRALSQEALPRTGI